MPICPGCEQCVPYDRLDLHERYCQGIWGNSASASVAIEEIDRRLRRVEADVDGPSAGIGTTERTIRRR